MHEWKYQIEQALDQALADFDPDIRRVLAAMRYSVSAGGKRIRPILTLGFCAACGGTVHDAIPFGCAVEMIHTYSLIHDDLPCMDNDDLRRGKPSCHRQFDEATALLAGDALLTKAFELLSMADISAEQRIEAVQVLAGKAGLPGMIGGQELDLADKHTKRNRQLLEKTDRLKTSALIEAACLLGVIAANGNASDRKYAAAYGHFLGLAFQIVDDLLDISGDEATLGKPIGSDAANGKITYPTLLGLDSAKELANCYTNSALDTLQYFSNAEYLKQLTAELLHREQ